MFDNFLPSIWEGRKKKRYCTKMEEEYELRHWDELIPEALGLIFKNLPLQEILTVVPRVCKSWGRAVMDPYCWQEIDIEEWSQNREPENLDRMLQMLIRRSCGSLRKLCVSGFLNDPILSFIADHAKSLHTLRLPRSDICDSMVEQIADKLSTITILDVSYCKKIGSRALEALGKNCKLLTGLRRTMHLLDVIDMLSQDDEAFAIATTMPKLKHLEMAYSLISTEGVLNILSHCPELELLDVRGCWNVKLDDKIVNKFSGVKVVGPFVTDCCGGWDVCSNISGSSGYLAWDFVAGEMDDFDDEIFAQSVEEVEMRFYDGFDVENAGFAWPQSP